LIPFGGNGDSWPAFGAEPGYPVIFESRVARNGRGAPDVVAPPLKARAGGPGRGDGAPLLATAFAVRRLTVRECERLQGLPDDYTLIPNYRKRLRADEIEEMAPYLGIPYEEALRVARPRTAHGTARLETQWQSRSCDGSGAGFRRWTGRF